jgi:hypothetical protein
MKPEDWLEKRELNDMQLCIQQGAGEQTFASDAMRMYAKEMLNGLAKHYNEEKIKALKNGGTLKSIDYLILDFMKEHLS